MAIVCSGIDEDLCSSEHNDAIGRAQSLGAILDADKHNHSDQSIWGSIGQVSASTRISLPSSYGLFPPVSAPISPTFSVNERAPTQWQSAQRTDCVDGSALCKTNGQHVHSCGSVAVAARYAFQGTSNRASNLTDLRVPVL